MIPQCRTVRLGKKADAEASQPLEPVVFGHSTGNRPRELEVVCVYAELADRLRSIAHY